jgi:hypothetical protein
MSDSKAIIRVNSSNTLSDLLKHFANSSDDIVFLDENSVITEPHLQLLTDFPRSASAALVGKQTDFADTLVRATQVVSASSASHKPTEANRTFTGAIRLSKRQAHEITKALEAAIARNAKGHALDLLLVALVRATIRVDAVELVAAPFARSEDEKVRAETTKAISKIKIPMLRLKLANRANDGFFSVFFLRRVSKAFDLGRREDWRHPKPGHNRFLRHWPLRSLLVCSGGHLVIDWRSHLASGQHHC